MSKEMTDTEIEAEVFRIVRNFQDKPESVIIKKIYEAMPDLDQGAIYNALGRLLARL